MAPEYNKPDWTDASDFFIGAEGKAGPEPTERYRNLLFK